MKTKTNELLKIGDKIFLRRGSSLIGFEMIEKITPTTAKSKNYSFCLVLYDDGGCYVKKQSVWNKTSAYLANEKLEKEWEETKILNWYYKNKDKFTQEEIIKIYNLLIK